MSNFIFNTAAWLYLVAKQEIEKIFATNVFGVLEVSRLMIKEFKKQNSGIIISVTSIGGLVAMSLNTVYHASKYAVEGFMQSLLYEMENFNIKVKLVEPGGVKTNFANSAVIIQDEKTILSTKAILIK